MRKAASLLMQPYSDSSYSDPHSHPVSHNGIRNHLDFLNERSHLLRLHSNHFLSQISTSDNTFIPESTPLQRQNLRVNRSSLVSLSFDSQVSLIVKTSKVLTPVKRKKISGVRPPLMRVDHKKHPSLQSLLL